jgi:serine O-acetyltransferase
VIQEVREAPPGQRGARVSRPPAFGPLEVFARFAPAVRPPAEARRCLLADAGLRPSDEPAGAARHDNAGPWPQVERLAAEMAQREPFLRQMLEAIVLRHETPAQIVGAALARGLRAGRQRDEGLQALFVETVRADPAVLKLLEADLAAVTAHDPACGSCLHALLHLKGFHALQVHRIAHSLWTRGRRDVAHWLAHETAAALGVDIHPAVPIGKGVMLDHATGVVIGETAVVEDGVSILHGVTLGATGKTRGDRHPKIRRGAMLGAGARILGNIEVGRMCKVGAGSVVVQDVPPFCTVAGVPARVVRTRTTPVADAA